MKNLLTAIAIFQLLLVVTGNDVPSQSKVVGCFYFGTTLGDGTLYPENLDASICTHLYYVHGSINNDTQEISLKSPIRALKTGGEGFVPRLVKLKTVNPDLKLMLHVLYKPFEGFLQDSSVRSNIIQSGVRWLNESGFDGLDFDAPIRSEDMDNIADLICEMKDEFNKYGFLVTTSINGAYAPSEETLSKIARCSDHVALITHYHEREFSRIAPMSMIKSNVECYTDNGIPAEKTLITIPAFGAIFAKPEDTKQEGSADVPENDDGALMGGFGVTNKELIRKMNDSSLGWTIRRDNETNEPSALASTGLGISYEDTASMRHKARYVMQEGLGGVIIVAMDFEDDEGIGGQGKFPLTRAVHSIFRGDESATTTN